MSYHAFSLDPRTVLGVGPGASPDEIREAYHAKSKKHHPDVGGDEWAFRMVARAYEVLKATAAAQSSQPWEQPGPAGAGSTSPQAQRWTWARDGSVGGADFSTFGRESWREMAEGSSAPSSDQSATIESGSAAQGAADFRANPAALRTVSVELVWARYGKAAAGRFSSPQPADDPTLSVCMVISWPPHSLVDRAAEFSSSGETLHILIELFEQIQSGGSIVGSKSRIEDGQFVAWLSYPDVVRAENAFLLVRETLQNRGLIPKLKTRDVHVPSDHDDVFEEPVIARAS